MVMKDTSTPRDREFAEQVRAKLRQKAYANELEGDEGQYLKALDLLLESAPRQGDEGPYANCHTRAEMIAQYLRQVNKPSRAGDIADDIARGQSKWRAPQIVIDITRLVKEGRLIQTNPKEDRRGRIVILPEQQPRKK